MQAGSDPAATIEAFYAAYNRADADAAAALYAPDGRHVETAQGRVATGREEVAAGLRHFLESFPDARWAPERTIVDGDHAAVPYVLTGTLRKRLGPFEPAGQALELRGVHLFTLGGGSIRATEDVWDSGTFARQMRNA
ncbi:MAG: hypothetical protein QOF17_1156 [Solirubrobacteraceae bacterium]|jgi:steroid delta-isomerase-like uncharacterized protein|nr:hypothetical protein [Solirubrobacteraceae bacterium]